MKISDWKKIVSNVFLFLFIFALFFKVYAFFNPLAFPGLIERLAWALFCIGVITIVLYIPYQRIVPIMILLSFKIPRLFGRRHGKVEGVKTFFENFYARHFVSQEKYIKRMFNLVFQVLLVLFLLALLIQQLSPELVFLDMNYFLISVIVFGVIAVLSEKENHEREESSSEIKKSIYIFPLLAGIAGSFIIWFKIQHLGMPGIGISGLAGILIVLLSVVVIRGD